MDIKLIRYHTEKIENDNGMYTFSGSETNKCLFIKSKYAHVEVKYDDITIIFENVDNYIIFTETERVVLSKRYDHISKEYIFNSWQTLECVKDMYTQ